MSKLQKIPVFLRKPIFERLFNLAETANLTKEEYMRYQKSQKERWDAYAVRTSAENKAKEARKDGIEIGVELGREENKTEVVRNMLTAGNFSMSQIKNLVNVSDEFILKIKKTLN